MLVDQITEKHPIDLMTSFCANYFSGLSEETIRDIIKDHWNYGTIDALIIENEVLACIRWNVDPTGKILDILDLCINGSGNGVRIMKHLMARNWIRFPQAKFIRFKRYRKYPERRERMYSIRQFLHINGGQ